MPTNKISTIAVIFSVFLSVNCSRIMDRSAEIALNQGSVLTTCKNSDSNILAISTSLETHVYKIGLQAEYQLLKKSLINSKLGIR